VAGTFAAGRVLGRSFSIWRKNIVTFTVLVAIAYLPLVAYALGAYPLRGVASRSLADVIGDFVLYTIVCGFGLGMLWFVAPLAVIHGVLQQLRGERASLLGCLRVFLARLLPALAVGILVGWIGFLCTLPVAFLAGFVAAAGGPGEAALVALAVPPILIACAYWVAVPVAAVERPGIVASLQRSARLTRGSRGSVFAIVLVVAALDFVPWLLLPILPGSWEGPVASWAFLLVLIALSAYGAVATSVAYHDLRVARDGVGVDDLVRVFA
jgi:hypothetical protein